VAASQNVGISIWDKRRDGAARSAIISAAQAHRHLSLATAAAATWFRRGVAPWRVVDLARGRDISNKRARSRQGAGARIDDNGCSRSATSTKRNGGDVIATALRWRRYVCAGA